MYVLCTVYTLLEGSVVVRAAVDGCREPLCLNKKLIVHWRRWTSSSVRPVHVQAVRRVLKGGKCSATRNAG